MIREETHKVASEALSYSIIVITKIAQLMFRKVLALQLTGARQLRWWEGRGGKDREGRRERRGRGGGEKRKRERYMDRRASFCSALESK